MKQLIKLDATALSNSACFMRMYNFAVRGYREKPSIDIEYGKAFHTFAEQLERNGGDDCAAIIAAQTKFKNAKYTPKKDKDWMNLAHLTLTCAKYAEHWKTDTFRTLRSPKTNTPLVELKFAIPLIEDDPDYDVALCGTMDRIGRIGTNGVFAICDYKTTGSWDADKYLNGYRLSHQLMIYHKAVRWYTEHKPDSIFAQLNPLRAFIEGIFLKKDSGTSIKRSTVFEFNDEMTDEFDAMLIRRVRQFLDFLRLPNKPRDGILSGVCQTAKFGQCPYWAVCCGTSAEIREQILTSNFTQNDYDPLNFDKETPTAH